MVKMVDWDKETWRSKRERTAVPLLGFISVDDTERSFRVAAEDRC